MRRNARQDAINRLREQQAASASNDWFFDKWENDFDRTAKRSMKAFIVLWVGILIANIAIWGVVIWAIIQLVQWVTAK